MTAARDPVQPAPRLCQCPIPKPGDRLGYCQCGKMLPHPPRLPAPRVSDEQRASIVSDLHRGVAPHASDVLALLGDDKDAFTALEAENARLREALAKAKRDAWIAGRDAAADRVAATWCIASLAELARRLRALTLPVETQGGSDG